MPATGSRPRWRRLQEDNDAVHGVTRSMPHHDIAGEPVGKASGYVVESCDAVCPQGVIPTWRQCASRWIKSSARQLQSDQCIMPWPTFRATQNTSSQFTLPRFLFQFCRCQTPDRRFRQSAFAGRRPSGWRLETIRPSPSEMSTQAAALVPCMAGTEAEAPQQGDRQCPGNRRSNATKNRRSASNM